MDLRIERHNLLIRSQAVIIIFKATVSKEQVEKYANDVIDNGKTFRWARLAQISKLFLSRRGHCERSLLGIRYSQRKAALTPYAKWNLVD